MRVDDGGPPAVDRDAGDVEDALVDRVEAGDLLVLVSYKNTPIEARLTGRPAVSLGDLELLAPVRRVGEELLRNAADVDAGAAEATRFGDRDLRAVGSRYAAGANAARAGAYRE
jgi:hypothetical protein